MLEGALAPQAQTGRERPLSSSRPSRRMRHTPALPIAKPLFSYRKHWAHRFGVAPFLPMTRAEMEGLGWHSCDVILVTGDAYIDHPSFGMAIVGRLLEPAGISRGDFHFPPWPELSKPTVRLTGDPSSKSPMCAPRRYSYMDRKRT